MFKLLLLCYIGISLITGLAFFLDKRFAENRARRIPEKWLHSLELLGGWPGALISSQLFRHKRAKASYMYILYGISLVHICLWVWWLIH